MNLEYIKDNKEQFVLGHPGFYTIKLNYNNIDKKMFDVLRFLDII